MTNITLQESNTVTLVILLQCPNHQINTWWNSLKFPVYWRSANLWFLLKFSFYCCKNYFSKLMGFSWNNQGNIWGDEIRKIYLSMKIATFIINMPWAETTSALISGLCFSPSPPDIGNYFLSDHSLKDLNLVPNKLIRIKFPP